MSALGPDTLAALQAAHGRQGSLKKTGLLLATADRPQGYSGATVSQLLSGTYPGGVARIEAAIRATLLSESLTCPELGEIRVAACRDWQAKPFAATNAQRVRVYRACRAGCPHATLIKE